MGREPFYDDSSVLSLRKLVYVKRSKNPDSAKYRIQNCNGADGGAARDHDTMKEALEGRKSGATWERSHNIHGRGFREDTVKRAVEVPGDLVHEYQEHQIAQPVHEHWGRYGAELG